MDCRRKDVLEEYNSYEKNGKEQGKSKQNYCPVQLADSATSPVPIYASAYSDTGHSSTCSWHFLEALFDDIAGKDYFA